MEPPYAPIYDTILLVAVGYIWWFFLKRWNRYTAELRPFIQRASIFLSFAFMGRLLDLISDFYQFPYTRETITLLYGVSIVGIVYTMIAYVQALEKSYVPVPKPTSPQIKHEMAGAYIVSGSKEKLTEIMALLKERNSPSLIFTRSPTFYSGAGEFATTIWITQATDAGIPPTKLHVIQEKAIQFAKEFDGSVIVIDCIEYLLMYNEFPSVFKFLVNLKDHLLMLNASLIVAVDEKAIGSRNYRLLLNEFEPL
ncbi:DUF835 domain-containing protein [Palaeococcus ferrophilus]|uniref:DUF835 domain-containing protein n=1 Tax=Palaeococcus ferrophilus TaxID=83868 RepID=UPI00064F004B|nr:DUF835 domain-containing protein [Palaeococcus ferrophilus]